MADEDYRHYIGRTGARMVAPMPLEKDTLRRFVQAIMDDDPIYYDEAEAVKTKFGGLAAPPLYPVHAFRRAPGTPDPLDSIVADPEADGTAGSDATYFGLEPVQSPYKRLLNGGNEIEFYRSLKVGERAVATARYADVQVKQGSSGKLLLVVIETRFTTESDELLLVNRQTLIWR